MLVDRQIFELQNKTSFIHPFSKEQLTNIGYDLRTGKIYGSSGHSQSSATLQPGESVFIEADCTVEFPNDFCGIVVLKNSRIRQGYTMDSPIYQPGHKTKIYFRITNISSDILTVETGEEYAYLVFNKLSEVPDHPYQGAYQNEMDWRGLENDQNPYEEQMQSLDQKRDEIKNLERNIYTNVLVILTVFIALFSFIDAGSTLISLTTSTFRYFSYVLSLLGAISFLCWIMSVLIYQII